MNKQFILSRVKKIKKCWVWTKTLSGTSHKYGIFYKNKKKYIAHRVSYEIFVGQIPTNLVVMHSCDNPPCVNPDHLSVGTHGDNTRDCVSKGRHSNQNKFKKICKRGHVFTTKNTYIRYRPSGEMFRTCRKCMAMSTSTKNKAVTQC